MFVQMPWPSRAQKRAAFVRRQRGTVQEPLNLAAKMLLQVLKLMAGFYSLGHTSQPEIRSQMQDAPHDRFRGGIGSYVAHERSINFYPVQREPSQIGQR